MALLTKFCGVSTTISTFCVDFIQLYFVLFNVELLHDEVVGFRSCVQLLFFDNRAAHYKFDVIEPNCSLRREIPLGL
jgi:hypothetical protein